jgi:CHAT domain-containing protein
MGNNYYLGQQNYKAAEPFLVKSLTIRQRLLGANHPDTANSLNNLAGLYYSMGRYGEAEPLYKQVLAAREQSLSPNTGALVGTNTLDTALALNNLASLYRAMGRYSEAEPLYQRALTIKEQRLGANHPDTATSLNNLAELYRGMGRYGEAEPLYKQALTIRTQILGINHPDTAQSLNNLAALYKVMGHYRAAEPLYKQALVIMEQRLGVNHPNLATSLNNLANLYLSMGRYDEAELLYKRALTIRTQQLGADHPSTANSLNNLAVLYKTTGQYSEAETLYKQALEIMKQRLGANHPDMANSLNNLAALYRIMGRYREAESLYKQALVIMEQRLGVNHPNIATHLNNLAKLYQNMRRYSEAEPLYKKALGIMQQQLGANHPNIATNLNNLAELYWEQNHWLQSLEFLHQGLEIEETNILDNVTTLTEQEQKAYLSTVQYSEDWIVSLHLQHLPTNVQASRIALTTILRRKGRILDTLSNRLQRLRTNASPADRAILTQLSQLYTQLTTLYNQGSGNLSPAVYRQQVQTLENQIEQYQKQLAQDLPELSTQPITVEAVQALIPKDAVLIEFFLYHPYNPKANPGTNRYDVPHYAVYLLPPQGDPIGLDLGEAQGIDTRLAFFRQQLTNPSSHAYLSQIAQQLYRILFQPLAPHLGKATHWIISPDSALNLIPFVALKNPQGQYLIEQAQVTIASSGRDLVRYPKHYTAQEPPVIIAHPNYNGDVLQATGPGSETSNRNRNRSSTGNNRTKQPTSSPSYVFSGIENQVTETWSDLPGTEREANLIASKLNHVLMLTGNEATKRAVKALRSPSILHFATHGFFLPQAQDNQNPLIRSGLILAGANLQNSSDNGGDDGVLTALEVSGLDLQGTKLVVMSACDTGQGDVSNGEGVYGLRRAFTLSGAESQLFSLWSVNDWATQALLTRYYDYLLKGRGRSDAWRQTQLDMLQGQLNNAIDPNGLQTITSLAHPNYWAAFVLSGEWEPLKTN